MNFGDRWLRSNPPGEEEMKLGSCTNSVEAMVVDLEGVVKSGLNEGNNNDRGKVMSVRKYIFIKAKIIILHFKSY